MKNLKVKKIKTIFVTVIPKSHQVSLYFWPIFQDTIVHKVKGKQVEKLRDEERKEEEFDRARQDTLEKISDYGKRKEVLENADTSYLTKTKHDVCYISSFPAL